MSKYFDIIIVAGLYWGLMHFDIWCVKQLLEAKVTICSSGLFFHLGHMLLCLATKGSNCFYR